MTVDWIASPPEHFEAPETPPGQPARVATLPSGIVRNNAPTDAAGGAADQWVPLGPSVVLDGQADLHPRVSGRVRSAAISDDGQRIYAGTSLGGTWYSGDGGTSWLPLDFYASTRDLTGQLTEANALSVGAVAATFSGADGSGDVVYAGTGEQKSRGYWSLPDRVMGIGIRVATSPVPAVRNGGPAADPWTLEATNLAGAAVYGIAIAPFGVFAATTKGLFRRPAGGGATWERVDTGLGSGLYSDLIVASGEGAGAARLYVATAEGRVAWSTDGQDGSSHWHEVLLPAFPEPVNRVASTESRLPDTLLESSGFSAVALADIDEDPTSPDAAWATASSNDVDTIVRVGFPAPSGPLTGEQRFRAFVRKSATSGTGTPSARIDLYENGTLRASGTETPIASATGQLFTQTFDVDTLALTDPTGAAIEARVVATKTGGDAPVRASVDVGAIGWSRVGYFVTREAGPVKRMTLARGNTPNQAIVYVLADGPRLWRIHDSQAARVLGLLGELFGPTLQRDQSEYDMALAVHPSTDAAHRDRIVVGGSAYLSEDGEWSGAIFSARLADPSPAADWQFPRDPRHFVGAGTHADVQDLVWVPGTGGADELWVACDGGLFRSRPTITPPPATASAVFPSFSWNQRNTGLASIEAIYLAQHPTSDALVLVGAQDNGALIRLGLETWRQPSGARGDAGGVAIDPNQARRLLAQWTKTLWRASTDGGATFSDLTVFHPAAAAATAAVKNAYKDAQEAEKTASGFYCSAAVVASGATTQLAIGTNRIWYTEDWGSTWRTLPAGTDPYDPVRADAPNGGQDVLDSASSGKDQAIFVLRWGSPDRIYALTQNGIYLVERQAGVWQASQRLYNRPQVENDHKRKNPPPSGQIPDDTPLTELAVQDATQGLGHLYAGTTGVGRQHVWWFDGASRWLSANLAVDSPVHAIVVDPNHPEVVYAGTDVGVWRGVGSFGGGADPTWTWKQFSDGLPEASCVDLVIHNQARVLRAALRGRGVWEVALDGVVHGPEVFLRTHAYDTRRLPVPVVVPPDPLTDPPVNLRYDASPDVRVWRAPGTPVAVPPSFTFGSATDPFDVWRLQAALRVGGQRIELTGKWDRATVLALRARKTELGLADAPLLDAAIWDALLGSGTPQANRLPFDSAPPDHADVSGTPSALPGTLRDEPDRRPGSAASCASGDQVTVYVIVHARFWRAIAAGRVAVALLRAPFAGNADLRGAELLPNNWADSLKADIASSSAGNWFGGTQWSYANTAQPSLRPGRAVDPREPVVVSFNVDLSTPAWPAGGWLLLAVVHSDDDPLTTLVREVPSLVRLDRHVAARSVRRFA